MTKLARPSHTHTHTGNVIRRCLCAHIVWTHSCGIICVFASAQAREHTIKKTHTDTRGGITESSFRTFRSFRSFVRSSHLLAPHTVKRAPSSHTSTNRHSPRPKHAEWWRNFHKHTHTYTHSHRETHAHVTNTAVLAINPQARAFGTNIRMQASTTHEDDAGDRTGRER